eukprot:634550-Amphidinium_carterae.1
MRNNNNAGPDRRRSLQLALLLLWLQVKGSGCCGPSRLQQGKPGVLTRTCLSEIAALSRTERAFDVSLH